MNDRIVRPRVSSSALRAALLALAGAGAGVVAGGCGGPLPGEADLDFTVPEDRLRVIRALDLEAAPAVDADAAADDLLDDPARARAVIDAWDLGSEAGAAAVDSVLLEDAPLPESGEVAVTLDECRAAALDHNLDLRVALLDPTIAAQSISEEEARFEAFFSGDVTYANSDTPTASTLAGSQIESLSGRAGLTQPLRTGGSISATSPFNRLETNNQFATLNPSYTNDLTLALSQPLLRNAGIRTNTHAIRIARYEAQASAARTKLEIIRVLSAVDRVYWNLHAAREELLVRVREYELALAQLERARRLVAAGDQPEVEIIRAESGVAERIEAIIVAENALRDRQRELKRILNRPGLEIDDAVVLVPATPPAPVRYVLEARDLVDAALATRMELLELELQLAQDASTIDFRRNQALPLLDFDYSYNVNGLGGTWNDSLDLLLDKNFEDHRFGLRAEVPLGNEAAESRLRRAMLTRIRRLATRESRSRLVEQEVFAATDQLQSNWQRVVASGQSVRLAARTLEAERRQFDLGLRTSTDVLDAQTRLANARLAEIRAVADYEIARTDLAAASGMLLGAMRVRWDPADPLDGDDHDDETGSG